MANPAGLFIWVDVATPDPDAASEFYKAVFGWDAEQASPNSDMPYWNLRKDGKVAAGMGKLSEEQLAQGIPPVWTSYIKVDDCEATVAKAQELGGTVLMTPMAIFDVGSMAMIQDPTGAAFAVWQSGTFDGSEEFNTPGFFSWNELATRDTAAAEAFYSGLFGWTTEVSESPIGPYTMFKNGDRMNGGMYDAASVLPDEVPSYWGVYITVDDIDAAVEAVKSAGGTVINGPFETGPGKMAAVTDNAGAHFLLFDGPTD